MRNDHGKIEIRNNTTMKDIIVTIITIAIAFLALGVMVYPQWYFGRKKKKDGKK